MTMLYTKQARKPSLTASTERSTSSKNPNLKTEEIKISMQKRTIIKEKNIEGNPQVYIFVVTNA